MKHGSSSRRMAVVPLCLALVLAGAQVFAVDKAAPDGTAATPKPKKEKTVKPKVVKAKNSKVQFLRGSEESPADRRARLKIECKGAANAGVCTGYTR